MILQAFRRIFKTDYPADQQTLVDKLAVTINNGFESLYNAFSNNISLTDNIFCTVKDVTLSVDSNGIPQGTASFTIKTTGTIKGISVISATNLKNSTNFPTGSPFIVYTQNGTIINITKIIGLPANDSFQIRVIAWG